MAFCTMFSIARLLLIVSSIAGLCPLIEATQQLIEINTNMLQLLRTPFEKGLRRPAGRLH